MQRQGHPKFPWEWKVSQHQCQGEATESLPEQQQSPPAQLRQVQMPLPSILPLPLPTNQCQNPRSYCAMLAPHLCPKKTLERKALHFPSC